MERGIPAKTVVRFGPFEADLAAGELRKHGVKLKLVGHPLEILAVLLERAGEAVTREELRARLWPSDTFVDFDHGLNASVNKLRSALGDSADNPRYVETLLGRGYRFIAPVDGSSAPNVASTATGPARPIPFFLRFRVGALALFLISTATLAGVLWRHSSRRPGIIERKLTANSPESSVSSAAVSPDGKYLAFTRGPKATKKDLKGLLPEFPGVEAQGWNICVADATRKNRWVALTFDGKSCKQPSWVRVQEGSAK